MNLGLGASCSVLALLSAPLLARLYGEPQVVGIVVALAGLFTVSGAATQYRVDLGRRLRFGALALTDVTPRPSASRRHHRGGAGRRCWAVVPSR